MSDQKVSNSLVLEYHEKRVMFFIELLILAALYILYKVWNSNVSRDIFVIFGFICLVRFVLLMKLRDLALGYKVKRGDDQVP